MKDSSEVSTQSDSISLSWGQVPSVRRSSVETPLPAWRSDRSAVPRRTWWDGPVDHDGRSTRLAIDGPSAPRPVFQRLERLVASWRSARIGPLLETHSDPNEPSAAPTTERRNPASEPIVINEPTPQDRISVSPRRSIPHRQHEPGSVIVGGRTGAISRWAKRGLDIGASALALLVLGPLMIGLAVLIYLTSGRPILYLQDRIGQGGRTFKIMKFRSMKPDAEGDTGPIWASNHDERCTPVGDWLRHTCLDELPQLINILKGDMSLVGPRPERPMFVHRFVQEIPGYERRHDVPVGLTGWAQVHGWRGRTSLRKRLQFDLDYIERWSFGLDVRILGMTVLHVLFNKVDWDTTTDGRTHREPTDALGRDPQPQRPDAAANVPGQSSKASATNPQP